MDMHNSRGRFLVFRLQSMASYTSFCECPKLSPWLTSSIYVLCLNKYPNCPSAGELSVRHALAKHSVSLRWREHNMREPKGNLIACHILAFRLLYQAVFSGLKFHKFITCADSSKFNFLLLLYFVLWRKDDWKSWMLKNRSGLCLLLSI